MAGKPRDPRAALRNRATQLVAVGRAADAIPLLRQALAADPDDANAHCMLALAFLRLGDPRAALDAAGRADPGMEWSHRLRSVALLRLGKKRAALAAAREAVRLAPETPEALAALVDAELGSRQWAAAREHAEELRRIAPERDLAHHALGLVSLRGRDWTAAEAHFRRALELDPTSWESMNNLALALRRQGRDEEAIARFHDAARLQPTSPLVQANLAASVARYAGSGVLALWLGMQAVRVMGHANHTSPPVVAAIAVAAVAWIVWFLDRRQRRLRALHPAVQAFYADARGRTTRRVVRVVLPRVVGSLVLVYLAVLLVGRLVERYAPGWEPALMLGGVVAAVAGIVLAIRSTVAPSAR